VKNKRSEFPRLREFARAYLHQDLIPEYGTVQDAAKAYLSDLDGAARQELANDAREMLRVADGWTTAEVNERLHAMGAAWTFVSGDEFQQVLRLFDRGH
jgi:CdiI immunity protein